MKLKLDGSIASPQDLRSLRNELHAYGSWLARTDIKRQTGAATGKIAAPELSPAAKSCLKTYVPSTDKASSALEELVAELDKLADRANHITITLAAPAPGSLKQTLVEWCRANLSDDILVSFQFNATILGGMVVRSGSHIFDWSFRRAIMDNRAKLPEVLRSVR
jgi:hypothetical protein